jgi:Ran GTPase-activating protein (RanGAP) involved in mRNA processing and transport
MNSQLEEINIRGNSIGDRGLALIEQLLIFNDRQIPSLHLLNISTNDITKEGVRFIIPILNCCRLKTLNISKNLLGDEGII